MWHINFLLFAIIAISCAKEPIPETQGPNPIPDNIPTSYFGSTIGQCNALNDTAFIVATAAAYFSEELVKDGLDSFFVRSDRFANYTWGDSMEIGLFKVKMVNTFQVNSTIVDNYFDAIADNAIWLESTTARDEVHEALVCLFNGLTAPTYVNDGQLHTRGIFTTLLAMFAPGQSGPCTGSGALSHLADAVFDVLSAGTSGRFSNTSLLIGGATGVPLPGVDLYEYYSYMLGCI